MSFYENFIAVCKRKNLPVGKVCMDCGLSNSIHSKWKDGQTVPKIDTLQKISEYLGVSTDYLIYGKNSALTEKQQEMLDLFNQLTPENQARVLERAEVLKESQSNN